MAQPKPNSVNFSMRNGYPLMAASSTLPISVKPDEDKHFVVGAIDFGTTYSGYAFAFTRDPDSIHMMRKWEGGDPGVTNQKVCILPLIAPLVT